MVESRERVAAPPLTRHVSTERPPRPHHWARLNLRTSSGIWLPYDPPIPNQQHPAPYFEVENAPASFSFSFQGVGVAINGSRIWGSYAYDVTLDDQAAVTYNASTMWFIGDALLYYQDGLDPTKTHTINVLPTVGAGLKFWLNTVTVFTDNPSEVGGLISAPSSSTQPLGGTTSDAPSTAGHSKTNTGAIAGGVIGGLAFVALVAGLLWYFARRRRQNPKVFDREQPSPFLATPSTAAPMAEASPFVPTQRGPYTPPRGDTKLPILAIGSDGYVPSQTRALPALPSGSASSSAPSESGRTVSDHSLAHGSAAQAAAVASPTMTHASSPAESSPDPNATVDRIIHLLAERMATRPPRQSVYGTDVPPPEYGA
ncbi:uncharacterized protein TRAVEDRAFT_52716 [Trametes versicolor FP-101664 SS1]|uniref:uncharacterized protein n=1 Tax=Trametes versicolor (strain FP-101664) TaxID=717944 RepID=UPI00046248E5|nr:uncharacterized protein TRAVEDRAFT_52716 [Trametes versicolor FP-101664 SS1]EIW53594.1 hypothetical protein TRAVEDRAFT_52716 [Trametes versicolor FP-101664 SS1]